VLEAILRQAVRRTGAERGLIAEVMEGGEVRFGALVGYQEKRFEGQASAFSRHVFERVMTTGEAERIENALMDPHYQHIESVQAMKADSLLCAPIRVDGRIVALLHLEDRRTGHFRPAHLVLLRGLMAAAEPALGAMRTARAAIEERDRLRQSATELQREAEADRRWFASEWSFGRFVGNSPTIRELESAIGKAAGTDFSVLLLGEPGTGKNLLARVLHFGGTRSTKPFVTVFCPSLERGLVESELFGHVRGAYTGATSDRRGRVAAAEGGTLLLDEIGELPPEIQPKLLRLLQERTYERLGETRELSADVRIIAATNRDLALEVQQGRFRRDLYDRLNYLPIRVPPLRERTGDIPMLLRHCLDQTAAGRWIQLDDGAISYLRDLDFSWPGNVRHIEQLAARLTADRLRGPASVADIARLLGATQNGPGAGPADPPRGLGLEAGLPRLLEEAECQWLNHALKLYPDDSRADLAARLRISEAALYRKLKRCRIGE
jgi:transcriptional regulator with GAF, ATPase, and Fis domain